MYKLTIKQGDTERVMEFATAELAQLYRDYHLVFGHWNGLSRWDEEKNVTLEQRAFIVDEKTELVNGEVVRFYKLTDGVQLTVEEVNPSQIHEVWRLFREKRNRFLAMTDWTQLSDAEISTEVRKDYRGYRNYLRVLPSLYDDDTIIRAKVYSFADWKKGMR